jgi:hypothetical protein
VAEREGFVPSRDERHGSRDCLKASRSGQLAGASWRRGRDSNPRNRYRLNGFQDRRYRPLSHLSGPTIIASRSAASHPNTHTTRFCGFRTARTRYTPAMRYSMVALSTALAVIAASAPQSLDAQSSRLVVATGLDNPRGLAFGPGGFLYVVEAGRGGDSELCLPVPAAPPGHHLDAMVPVGQ